MIRTNSKQAKENLYNYIKEATTDYLLIDCRKTPEEINTKEKLYKIIYNSFKSEKSGDYYSRIPESVVFEDWATGLAAGALFDYYLGDGAREILQQVLEETPEEAARYTTEQAEKLLTSLIYREIRN